MNLQEYLFHDCQGIVLVAISQYYEIIACQHYALVELINKCIDDMDPPFYYRHENEDDHLVTILKVRKEGWYARKQTLIDHLCKTTQFADDIIKHIAIEYMM